MHGMCQHCAAAAAQCRPRIDLDLSAHAVAAGRLQLPTSADLLGLWRRGDRTFWIMGRRLDDAGADPALPTVGNFGDRQRTANEAAERAVVSALALRTLARRQRLIDSHCRLARDRRCAIADARSRSQFAVGVSGPRRRTRLAVAEAAAAVACAGAVGVAAEVPPMKSYPDQRCRHPAA